MIIDLEQARNDTPATEHLIHFNNAGCSLSPSTVTKAVIEHLELEQRLGGYEAANLADTKISEFYKEFAKLLNCSPAEIAYVENASRAWDIALYSIDWQEGDQIITGENEYVSNYIGLLHLQSQKRVEIISVPCRGNGLLDLDKLRAAITPRSRMIALTHVSSQRGDIQPAAQVGKIAKEHELIYLLDACQSAGQLALDVKKLGCDFLCGTGRKYLRGPRGTGFLYASDRTTEFAKPIFADNHSAKWVSATDYTLRTDAKRFETWERYIAGKIGLTAAVKYANDLGLRNIEQRISNLAKELNDKLSDLKDVTVLEHSDSLSGIVTFQKQGIHAEAMAQFLLQQNINTSVSKQENAQLDLAVNLTGDINRASLHYFNTTSEIDRFIEVVSKI